MWQNINTFTHTHTHTQFHTSAHIHWMLYWDKTHNRAGHRTHLYTRYIIFQYRIFRTWMSELWEEPVQCLGRKPSRVRGGATQCFLFYDRYVPQKMNPFPKGEMGEI